MCDSHDLFIQKKNQHNFTTHVDKYLWYVLVPNFSSNIVNWPKYDLRLYLLLCNTNQSIELQVSFYYCQSKSLLWNILILKQWNFWLLVSQDHFYCFVMFRPINIVSWVCNISHVTFKRSLSPWYELYSDLGIIQAESSPSLPYISRQWLAWRDVSTDGSRCFSTSKFAWKTGHFVVAKIQ